VTDLPQFYRLRNLHENPWDSTKTRVGGFMSISKTRVGGFTSTFRFFSLYVIDYLREIEHGRENKHQSCHV
jgi:hypothetical protein